MSISMYMFYTLSEMFRFNELVNVPFLVDRFVIHSLI